MVCISRPLSFRGTGPWRSVEETPVQPLLFAKVSKRGGVGVALRRGHEVMRDFEECQCMQARQESDETRPNCQLGRGEGGYDICGTRANEIPRHTLLA